MLEVRQNWKQTNMFVYLSTESFNLTSVQSYLINSNQGNCGLFFLAGALSIIESYFTSPDHSAMGTV